jgi:hypothetical protein
MSNKRFFLLIFLMLPSMFAVCMALAIYLIGHELFREPFCYPYADFVCMLTGCIGLAIFFTSIENDWKKQEEAWKMEQWRKNHWYDRRKK